MKKIIALTLLISVIASLFCCMEASAAAEMKIYRLSSTPAIDGKIDAGEYYLLADSSYAYTYADNAEKDAENAEKNIYAGYDDNYLYVAATVTCACHVNEWVFVADGGENDYDIFDGHCMAVSVTSVNPATDDECLAIIGNDNFGWSDGFKTAIGRSFTLAITSDTGIQLSGVHYSHTTNYVPESDIYTDPASGETIRYNCANDANLPMQNGFFHVSHDDSAKLDVYEVRIPWGWIDYKTDRKGNKGENVIPFDRKDGTYCGLSVSLKTGDIDDDVYFNGGLASLSFGADASQYFYNYVPLVLSGKAESDAVASGSAGSASAGGSSTAATTGATDATTVSSTEATKTEATTSATTTKTENKTTTTSRAATTTTTAADNADEEESSPIGIIIPIVAILIVIAVVVVIILKKKKVKSA